jgi:hypothetical protein
MTNVFCCGAGTAYPSGAPEFTLFNIMVYMHELFIFLNKMYGTASTWSAILYFSNP